MLLDRSLLIGQKWVENAKIEKFPCDILGDFQTLSIVLDPDKGSRISGSNVYQNAI